MLHNDVKAVRMKPAQRYAGERSFQYKFGQNSEYCKVH